MLPTKTMLAEADRRLVDGDPSRALELIGLEYRRDKRGWLLEVRRESRLPNPTVQTNVSFSRKGVIRGLHYHERGQDDLFTCLVGTARVVFKVTSPVGNRSL